MNTAMPRYPLHQNFNLKTWIFVFMFVFFSFLGSSQNIIFKFDHDAESYNEFCTVQVLNSTTDIIPGIVSIEIKYDNELIATANSSASIGPGLSLINLNDRINQNITNLSNFTFLRTIHEEWDYLKEEVTACIAFNPIQDVGLPASECGTYRAKYKRPHLLYPFDDDTLEYTEEGLGMLWEGALCNQGNVEYSLHIWELDSSGTFNSENPILKRDSLFVNNYPIERISSVFKPNSSYTWTVDAICPNRTIPAYETWVFHFDEDTIAKYFGKLVEEPKSGALKVKDGILRFYYPERYGTRELSAVIINKDSREVVDEVEQLVPTVGKNYYEVDVTCKCESTGFYVLQVENSDDKYKYLIFYIDKSLIRNKCNK